MNRLIVLCLLITVSSVAADDVFEDIKAYFWSDSVTGCPFSITPINRCPDTTIFSYYSCCKDSPTECCFRLQGWVIMIIVTLIVSLLFSLIGSIISCICCCNRR